MKWFLTTVALIAASLFLALESVMLLYAINNHHFAYYYALFGLGSLVCILFSYYLNRKSPAQTQGLKILNIFTHGLVYLLLVCGTLLLIVNYWFRHI